MADNHNQTSSSPVQLLEMKVFLKCSGSNYIVCKTHVCFSFYLTGALELCSEFCEFAADDESAPQASWYGEGHASLIRWTLTFHLAKFGDLECFCFCLFFHCRCHVHTRAWCLTLVCNNHSGEWILKRWSCWVIPNTGTMWQPWTKPLRILSTPVSGQISSLHWANSIR